MIVRKLIQLVLTFMPVTKSQNLNNCFLKAGSSPLPDNDPRDKYLYEMTVFTGSRKGSGKSSPLIW